MAAAYLKTLRQHITNQLQYLPDHQSLVNAKLALMLYEPTSTMPQYLAWFVKHDALFDTPNHYLQPHLMDLVTPMLQHATPDSLDCATSIVMRNHQCVDKELDNILHLVASYPDSNCVYDSLIAADVTSLSKLLIATNIYQSTPIEVAIHADNTLFIKTTRRVVDYDLASHIPIMRHFTSYVTTARPDTIAHLYGKE